MSRDLLVQNELLFRALIESSTDAITLITSEGTIIYANPSAIHITGYTPGELCGTNGFVLIHSDDREQVIEQITDLLKRPGENFAFECRVYHKDGSWRWVEGTVTNMLAEPAVGAIVGNYRDITEHKQYVFQLEGEKEELRRLEEQLQYAERKFRSLVESNIAGVMVTDKEGHMYEVNNRLVQLLGYSREELLSGTLSVPDLLVPGYIGARSRAWQTLISQGASLPEEKEYICKDGSHFPALVTAATINPERTRALVMCLDISDRKAAELRKQEFLEMVNHELRTPLTVIQGMIEVALMYIERIPDGSPMDAKSLRQLDTLLQQALRQAEIETRLIAELLDVAHTDMEQFQSVLQYNNLVTIVQQVVASQRPVASSHQIEMVLPSQSLVPVMVDADRIEQALTNYLINALKYSPPDQTIVVRLGIEGDMARVSVQDQGPGLTLEQQERVWERFYQTRTVTFSKENAGLGLGLSIVQSIIAQHQGQVGVESYPGQGATFWFMLPLAQEQV